MRIHELAKYITIYLIIVAVFTAAGCGGGGNDSTNSSSSVTGGSGSEPDPVYGNSITLAWDPPSDNTDGSPLTDLAGYIIYYGTSSSHYTESIDLGNATTATIDNLTPGQWCFSTTAYNTSGNESSYSNEICEYI
jgi:hypothetical protein